MLKNYEFELLSWNILITNVEKIYCLLIQYVNFIEQEGR